MIQQLQMMQQLPVKRVLIVVFGEQPKNEKDNFYDVINWAAKRGMYKNILVVDKFYNTESDEETFGVKNITHAEFTIDLEVHYDFATNFSRKNGTFREGFTEIWDKLRNAKAQYTLGSLYCTKYNANKPEEIPEGAFVPYPYFSEGISTFSISEKKIN